MPASDGTILFEDAELRYLNFRGIAGQYNREGDRNFCVMINDEKILERMIKEDWNIKYTKPREEGDEPRPYVQVSVKFTGRPPRVVMITSRGHTDLTEDTVGLLDHAAIKTVDLILNPYVWDVNGRTGKKAYLKSLFMTIDEDYLEQKYADVTEKNLPDPSPSEY